ncbi:39S ribosomal protein L51, mitochondrial [Pseudogymnoascus australis]
MGAKALKKLSSGQNGVGAFILQCKKLDFHYCDWAGSSRGMNAFLRDQLPAFAAANPSIEITGTFINGREKAICVRNLQPMSILQKAVLLRDASGEKLKTETKPVKSINDSVRGIWSPYHSGPMTV